MAKSKQIRCALTVAGSDSGGGAGIQADLNTFAALGVHGTSVVTCLTAQNPRRVIGVQSCAPDMVKKQLAAVFEELPPAAVKTGMLYSRSIVSAVAGFFHACPAVPLVVDPVMISTSGHRLLDQRALNKLLQALFPLAAVITPNLAEASAILQQTLRTPEDMRRAARLLKDRFGCAVLLKGGHLKGCRQAIDIFWDGKSELLLEAPYLKGVRSHGTGCTISAAIAGFMAQGHPLISALSKAKEFVTGALAGHRRVARHAVLNWFWMSPGGMRSR